jgi:hypothetical protein
MLNSQFAVYFGSEREEEFIGFIAQGDFYAVASTVIGITKEKGKEFLRSLANTLSSANIGDLSRFETILVDFLKQSNVPAATSLACGFRRGEKLFLKTISGGKIYIKRAGHLEELIVGDKSASGYIEPGDFFIFTTSEFSKIITDKNQLKNLISDNSPTEVRESITPILKAQDDHQVISLFVLFEDTKTDDVIAVKKEAFDLMKIIKSKIPKIEKKKLAIAAGVIVIFTLFLWSVISGGGRMSFLTNEKIESKRERIIENLNQASDVAFLNVGRAKAQLAAARADLAELRREFGDKNSEIIALEKLISEKEESIFKEEERASMEFFDLAVESRDVRGKKLYLDGDSLVILSDKGMIYFLSLSKKSLTKKNYSESQTATYVAAADGSVFLLNNKGIYKEQGNKVKKVVNNDDDWGKIIDLVIFNNNIYILDSKKSKIYKYTPTEDGYSAKSSYLAKGTEANFNGATSMAIDSSVYVGLSSRILKYTSGLQDGFATTFPEANTQLDKIVTSADLEKIYGWNRRKGVIYILAKTGDYERKIKSSILTKAQDLIVFKNAAYAIHESKIYKINLD